MVSHETSGRDSVHADCTGFVTKREEAIACAMPRSLEKALDSRALSICALKKCFAAPFVHVYPSPILAAVSRVAEQTQPDQDSRRRAGDAETLPA